MPRAVSVWLPTWPTDLIARRLGRGASAEEQRAASRRVLLVTRAVASREVVVGVCARGQDFGVAPGMDVAQARTRLPTGWSVLTNPHTPARDAEALHALACWCTRFSPVVAVDGADGMLIDAHGLERLFRSEIRWLRALVRGLTGQGIAARIGVAGTYAAAWGLARYAPQPVAVAASGEERAALSPLPMEALNLEPGTRSALAEMGVSTAGDVFRLPRHGAAARFGEALFRRVDLALGQAMEVIEPVRPAPAPMAEMVFDGATDRLDAIEAATGLVLDSLLETLVTRERGARELELRLTRADGQSMARRLRLCRPSTSRRHLWSLLRPALDSVDLGEGVEEVRLTATRTGRRRHRQGALPGHAGEAGELSGHAGEAAWGELIDTLVARLGAERVVRVEMVESHLPERTFRVRPVLEPAGWVRAAVTRRDRPTRLFERPEPARAIALTPDGPVRRLHWRGAEHDVVSTVGPERVSAEWWRWMPEGQRRAATTPPDRDYFALQLAHGRWVWACRQVGAGTWFVHGEW